MTKINLTESLDRIQKIRKILKSYKNGLYHNEICKLTNIKPSSLTNLIYNFLKEKVSVTKVGRNKLFKLIDINPSDKERRLIKNQSAIKKGIVLRKNGFSHSEIIDILKKDFGSGIDTRRINKIKMTQNGLIRYKNKISLERKIAGHEGGIICAKNGHILKIGIIARRNRLKNVNSRISKSSKNLTLSKIRIISHCLFDGFINNYARGGYTIGYCNSSGKLLNEFTRDMEVVYGLKPSNIIKRKSKVTSGKDNYVIRYFCKAAVRDLERYIIFNSSGKQLVPSFLDINKAFKKAFLRAFWDDEGMVGFSKRKDKDGYEHTHRFVEAYQKNMDLLNQIKKLHENFKIYPYIYDNRIKISNIDNLKRFSKNINFSRNSIVCRTKSNWYGMRKSELLNLAIKTSKI